MSDNKKGEAQATQPQAPPKPPTLSSAANSEGQTGTSKSGKNITER